MWNRRVAAAWGTWLVVGGVITASVCHGLYHQSAAYARKVEADLGRFFGLPVEVGGVTPHSFTAKRFIDVRIWLPDRKDLVFSCPSILWDESGVPGTSDTAIDIYEPVWLLGSDAWEAHEYTRLLQAGLKHNFQAIRVGVVRLHQAKLEWRWPGCHLHADGVDGKLVFDSQGWGQADLVCHDFNGYVTAAPIHISAKVNPEADNLLPEVVLVMPELPLASLGIDQMLQSQVTQGQFAGTITLRQSDEGDRISLAGRATGVRLAEWTQRVPGGAIPGVLNLTIEEVVVKDRQFQELRFRGEASEVGIDGPLARFGWPGIGGTAQLRVFEAILAPDAVRRLSLNGRWDGGSLNTLAQRLLGRTGIEGRLRARINMLVIENNEMVNGDIELSAEPPDGKPGTIERSLLVEAFERVFGLSLPVSMLPQRVEYVQMGMRILADRSEVRILSGQGPAGPALITVRILGQDLPLGTQLDLRYPIDLVRRHADGQIDSLSRRLRESLRPSTRPFSHKQAQP